ncbi:MAG: hypothetical protein AABZ47_12350 [Planctomycetota bacterium]
MITVAQADFTMFAQNIMLLIAFLIFGGAAIVGFISIWTVSKALIWQWRQNRSWKKFAAGTLRADGKKYPKSVEAFCSRCGKYDRQVYMVAASIELCPPCYEDHWRTEEFAKRSATSVIGPGLTSEASDKIDSACMNTRRSILRP